MDSRAHLRVDDARAVPRSRVDLLLRHGGKYEDVSPHETRLRWTGSAPDLVAGDGSGNLVRRSGQG